MPPSPLVDALQQGASIRQHFAPGLYEIHYRLHAPEFDPAVMMFEWQGQTTGPWDYAPSGPRDGECLLPKVHLKTSNGADVQARVFIPRSPELEQHIFHGRVGFLVKEAGELTLELSASLPVEWLEVSVVPVTDFADTSLSASDFNTDQPFLLDEAKIAALKANWGKAPWHQHLERILDDCGRFAPPETFEDACQVARGFLKTKAVYEDNVIFWGMYLTGLSLRALVLDREDDHAQLARWIDALVELPVWGNTLDPHGRNHNNDLTADFNMLGLAIALSWHGPRLGRERVQRIREKIRFQGRAMHRWITGSRSSWPGVSTQNHAYFGYQTLLLAGASLLHSSASDDHEALEWLQIAAAASRRFSTSLPSDGTYHEGLGYIGFGMFGLMPSLFLLEQMTGRAWLPQDWLAAHFRAVNTVLPTNASGGFWIDDGDAYLPCNVPLTLWAWQHAPDPGTREAASQVLAKIRTLPAEITLQPNRIIGCFWRLILTPELTEADANLPALQTETWRSQLLPASGYGVLRPTGDSRAFFLTAPPHGHEFFKRERHIYSYGHHHPDSGNVVLVDNGTWVLADTGYTFRKTSSEHNVLLVNGKGQHNDGHVWMAPPPWDIEPERAQRRKGDGFTEISVELAPLYPDKLGLRSWRRTVTTAPSALVVVDEMQSYEPVTFTINWVASLPWEQKPDGSYNLQQGWQLDTLGDASEAISEQLTPARRYCKDGPNPVWHALRLSNPQPATTHRLVSVFTHTPAKQSAPDLLRQLSIRA